MPLYVGFVKEVDPSNYPDHTLPGNLPYPDNSLPGSQPRPDNTLPPIPPDLKPDNTLPTPPPIPSHPIYYPITPEHPIALPPGEIWPPICECEGGISGPVLLLVDIVGIGKRWLHYVGEENYPPKSKSK